MLTQVTPIEYVRPMGSGRTKPLLLVCETPTGDSIDTVVKFSAGCDEGVSSLVREVVAACLAADLSIIITVPDIEITTPEWIASLADEDLAARIRRSSLIHFGSTLVTGQYAAWATGYRLRAAVVPT